MNSYFQGSRNVKIRNLQVLNGSVAPESEAAASSQARADLYTKVVAGAIHDSNERCDAPKCHPETRKAVQEHIMSWIRGGDEGQDLTKIMWITGPAGSGKTAISGSIAETCEKEGLLASTFFFSSFSGSRDRCSSRGLVATLAYQLIQLDGMEDVESHILSITQRNRANFDMRLLKQMDTLILKPLRDRHASGAPPISAKVIIIDGLDEVQALGFDAPPASSMWGRDDPRPAHETAQLEVLFALQNAAAEPTFPFRIIIASRPERIIEGFLNDANRVHKVSLHDQYNASDDIRLFLTVKFADLRRRYHISSPWPSEASLEQLVETASSQFIYAATVLRFLESNTLPDPQSRLQTVLDLKSQGARLNPLALLDILYTRVLMSSPDPFLAAKWLGAIHCLSDQPAWFIRQLLQEFEGHGAYLLENLASVVKTPQDLEDHGEPKYEFYHKSLLDFLQSEHRGKELGAAFRSGDSLITERIYQVLQARTSNVPVSESRLSEFHRHFLVTFNGDLCRPPNPPREVLATCDVVWWVHKIAAEYWDERPKLENYLEMTFSKAHTLCEEQSSESFRDCLAMCKHWRGNMIRACCALGWNPPGAVELFKENLDRLYFGRGAQGRTCKFKCPEGDGERRVCPSAESLPPTIYKSTAREYEHAYAVAAYVLSCLPSNWQPLCDSYLEANPAASVFDALSAHIPGTLAKLKIGFEQSVGVPRPESRGWQLGVASRESQVRSQELPVAGRQSGIASPESSRDVGCGMLGHLINFGQYIVAKAARLFA